jgi:Ca2+-binding EF-hand superfamily protein
VLVKAKKFYWYNKRTGQSCWDKPAKPEIKDFLAKQFKAADNDGSGSLDGEEFKGLLQKLGMGVTEEQAMDLLRMADSDGTGGVEYGEFVETVPVLLMQVMLEEVEDFNVDWVEVEEAQEGANEGGQVANEGGQAGDATNKANPNSYWYNKRTGTSQTQRPIRPDITEYLSRKVKAANYNAQSATQYLDTKATATATEKAEAAKPRKPLVKNSAPVLHEERGASSGARSKSKGKQKNGMQTKSSAIETASSPASLAGPAPVTSAWANKLIQDPAAIAFYCVEQTEQAVVMAMQGLGNDLCLADHKRVILAMDAEERKRKLQIEQQLAQQQSGRFGQKSSTTARRHSIRRSLNTAADINLAFAVHLAARMLAEDDGHLSWSSLCAALPKLLSELLTTHSDESFHKDWVHLVSGPMDFYYNKRTMEKQQAEPRMPTIADYLMRCFKQADRDRSGSLGSDELWGLVETMDLKLSMRELTLLRKEMDGDGDGTVSWREFIEALPVLLKKANEANGASGANGEEMDAAAWIELPLTHHSGPLGKTDNDSSQPTTYWYHKVTAESRWKPPRAVLVRNRAHKIFEEYDKDQSGALSIDELTAGLIAFGFRRKEAARLCMLLDRTGDGLVTLNELLEGAPRFLKEMQQEEAERQATLVANGQEV